MSIQKDEFANFVLNSTHQGTVRLCVEFTVKPDKVDAFYEEFNKCVAISVKEAGCKQYQTFKDFKNPTTVWLLEEWDSVADLKAHMLAQQSSGIPNLDGILAAGLNFNIML